MSLLFFFFAFLSQPHSSSWFPITPGAPPIMPTTRLPCPSSATRTSFLGRVLTTTFLPRQAPAFQTTMKSSKRLPSTVLPGYSSCKPLVGNTIFLPMPWDLRCIQPVLMSVFFFSCLSTHHLPFHRSTSNHLLPFLSPTKGKELSRPILVLPSCHPSSTSGPSKLGLATSPSYISSLTWYLNSLYIFSEAVKLTVSHSYRTTGSSC